jgi:tRNA(fMet)-specific endonuclease VapC
MHILDTDTLTHLYAGHPKVIERLRVLDDPVVGTTIVTKIEILRGRMDFVLKAATLTQLIRAQDLLTRSEELLQQILVIPFDARAVRQFDNLRSISSLRKMGRADLLIASIVLANHATLVTRNTRHFRMIANLKVVNWVA